MSKPQITEAQAERIHDRMVNQVLSGDRAYLNAENAEDQAKREDEVEQGEWEILKRKYEIVS